MKCPVSADHCCPLTSLSPQHQRQLQSPSPADSWEKQRLNRQKAASLPRVTQLFQLLNARAKIQTHVFLIPTCFPKASAPHGVLLARAAGHGRRPLRWECRRAVLTRPLVLSAQHGSLNRYHNSHPLRERARKLSQGILIIR